MNFINTILIAFAPCFSISCYRWFVIVVLGIATRTDNMGLTSVMRSFPLEDRHYHGLNYFFKRASWCLQEIGRVWIKCVVKSGHLYQVDGYALLFGDHTKNAKDAKRMPGIKRQFQESESAAKPDYFFGHVWGSVGVLIGNKSKQFCLPLSLMIHGGLASVRRWSKESDENTEFETDPSMNVQMIRQAGDAAAFLSGRVALALDRAFLSVPVLKALAELNQARSERPLAIVTKAKSNCVAYEPPPKKLPGTRGAPRKKGDKVCLRNLFDSGKDEFIEDELFLYGKKQKAKYLSVDLLWGQKLYQELRFILVEVGGKRSILVTTDLKMSAATAIKIYGLRFKIECTFKEMKQSIGAFSYHFWCKAMPKLNRFSKKEAPDPLEKVTSAKDRESILQTTGAIERFAQCCCISTGILQLLSLEVSGKISVNKVRYLRTQSNAYASEATMMVYLRQLINSHLGKTRTVPVIEIIKRKIAEHESTEETLWREVA